LVAVAAMALLLFNFPLLALFDVDVRVLGVPLLWAYLFVVWTLVIGLVAWVSRDAHMEAEKTEAERLGAEELGAERLGAERLGAEKMDDR